MTKDKCGELKKTLKKAIVAANKSQKHFEAQTRKVNKTLAKYTKKLEELDKQLKRKG